MIKSNTELKTRNKSNSSNFRFQQQQQQYQQQLIESDNQMYDDMSNDYLQSVSKSQQEISKNEKQYEDKSIKNKVCFITINKNWTIKKQMRVALITLSVAVLILVFIIVIANLLLAELLIKKSSKTAINQQIKENLYNSASEYSEAILEIFTGYSSSLEILSRITLSAMKLDDKIFDFDYVKEFPIIGPGPIQNPFNISQSLYYSYFAHHDIPDECEKSHEIYPNDFKNKHFTYSKWQYASFGTKNKYDITQENGTKILEACDIMNYFLKDLYFDKRVTHIEGIYFGWEGKDQIFMHYPGGLLGVPGLQNFTNFNRTMHDFYFPNRTWYNNTKVTFHNNQNQGESYQDKIVISGPYHDYGTDLKTISISKAIVDLNGNFLGVCGVDIIVSSLQKIIQEVKFYENGYLILVENQSGIVLNDPHNHTQNYTIYQQEITGIDNVTWGKIMKEEKEQQLIAFDHLHEREILIIKKKLKPTNMNQEFTLMVIVPKQEAYKFLTELEEMMDDTFDELQKSTAIIIIIICAISIITGILYSEKIVSPLSKLTQYAKSINSNATNKQFAETIDIDLDELKAHDKIGELIDSFKNLLKGLSSIKKGARTEISTINEKNIFPTNYYQNTKMRWRPYIDLLKDYDSQQKQQKQGVNNVNNNNSDIKYERQQNDSKLKLD